MFSWWRAVFNRYFSSAIVQCVCARGEGCFLHAYVHLTVLSLHTGDTENIQATTESWLQNHVQSGWCAVRFFCLPFFFFLYEIKSWDDSVTDQDPPCEEPTELLNTQVLSVHLPPQNPAFRAHFSITIVVSQIHSLLLLFLKQKTNDNNSLVKMNSHNKGIEPLSNTQQFRSLHYSTKIPKIVEVPICLFLVDD